MKIRIRDRRYEDIGLKNNKVTGKPIATIQDSLGQRVINFVKKLSITPIEINKAYDPKKETELVQYLDRYITNKFINANPNLRDKFGIIKSVVYKYFNYELVEDNPKTQSNQDKIESKPVTAKQLELSFEQFYNRVFEKYRN